MIAIGLDPSVSGFGWAVIAGSSLERCGVWRTSRNVQPGQLVADDNLMRFEFLAQSLVELIEQVCASHDQGLTVFVERLGVFGDRFTTAIGQGRCVGVVGGVCAALRVPVVEVEPAKVKKLAWSGKRRKVEKSEVREAVVRLYPNAEELIPPGNNGLNASDAIAIAHIGAQSLGYRLAANDGSNW